MRNCLLFIFCWLEYLSAGFAQQGLPSVYVIRADSALFEIDTAHVQALTDPQGSYTFEQVRKSGLFRVEPRYDPKRQSHVYWTRMRFRNDLPHKLNLYFCEFDSNYFGMYWLDSSNRWRHLRAGSYVPKSQLPNYNGNREYRRLLFISPPVRRLFFTYARKT